MRPRDILAANLKALMASEPRLDTLTKITAASDGRLSNGKLDRIRRAAGGTGIDTLEELAKVFSVESWKLLLLVPDAHALRSASTDPWPFKTLDPKKLMALEPHALSRLEGAIQAVANHLGENLVTHAK